MSFSKGVILTIVVLFSLISIISFFNKNKKEKEVIFDIQNNKIQEIVLNNYEEVVEKKQTKTKVAIQEQKQEVVREENIPSIDLIDRFFTTDSKKLPIVETITYTSRVPWIQGRPAWIADYASHYSTTRHFIARSLNRKPDYFTQKVSPGDRFNVLKTDKNISFYLLIDISRAKMFFYYLDNDLNERVLVKTYNIGLGRKDSKRFSKCLTPIGKYSLGSKVAIYKPNIMGYFQDKKIEMIKVFGTRWIPFQEEIEDCSESAKGLGIHGAPWKEDETGKLVEDKDVIGKYNSDGCVRLLSEDIEELFAIIISRPTQVELVQDFYQAKLSGKEKILD